MKLIAHRGNLNGRNLQLENSPANIMEAIWKGYDVEIDVWHVKNEFYLGHDEPLYEVDESSIDSTDFKAVKDALPWEE